MIDLKYHLDVEEAKKLYLSKRPMIIEAFVEYYGEKHRDIITEKLCDINVVFYNTIETQRAAVFKKEEELKKKYAKLFVIEIGVDVKGLGPNQINDLIYENEPLNNYFSVMFGHPSAAWMFDPMAPVYSFRKNAENTNYSEKDMLSIFEYFIPGYNYISLHEFKKDNSYNDTLEEIDQIINLLDTLHKEYINDYNSEVLSLAKQVDENEEELEQILKEYQQDCMLYIFNSLKFNDKFRQFIDHMTTMKPLPRNYSDVSEYICSFDDVNFAGILSFSPKNTEIVKNPNIPINHPLKQKLLKERKLFYNDIGVDISLDHSIEVFDREAQKLGIYIPDTLIDTIEEIRNVYKISAYKKYYQNKPEFLQATNDVVNEKEIYTICNIFAHGKVCLSMKNFQLKDQTPYKPQVFFNPYRIAEEYIDVSLIHELNHYIGYYINKDFSKQNNDFNFYATGFDDSTPREGSSRNKYTLFNEYLNQASAIEITKFLHDLNYYIFNSSDCAEVVGGTYYEYIDFILYSFYSDLSDVIKRSVIESKPEVLIKHLGGKNNYEKLIDIVNRCGDEFFDNVNNGALARKLIDTSIEKKWSGFFKTPELYVKGHELEISNKFIGYIKEYLALRREFKIDKQSDNNENTKTKMQIVKIKLEDIESDK